MSNYWMIRIVDNSSAEGSFQESVYVLLIPFWIGQLRIGHIHVVALSFLIGYYANPAPSSSAYCLKSRLGPGVLPADPIGLHGPKKHQALRGNG